MKKVTIELPDDCEVKIVKKRTKFKDGDVLYIDCKTGESYVFIYKSNPNDRTSCYCKVLIEDDPKINYDSNYVCFDQNVLEIRKADEYEKNIVIDALKRDKKRDILKKFFNIELPIIKTYQDLIDKDTYSTGYYVLGDKIECDEELPICNENIMAAHSKKVAKSMRAMAMISQLMPYYGGEVTDKEWTVPVKKYIATRYVNSLIVDESEEYHFLAFHTKEQRDEFISNNKKLVMDYLMIETVE